MANRVHNYYPGPAALPVEVLEKIKEGLPVYGNAGMSVMEMSHRGPDFSAIHDKAMADFREILSVPDTHKILFLQGGANLQFVCIPMNLRGSGQSADYVLTGAWSKKALKEAKVQGEAKVAATSEETNFSHIPEVDQWTRDPGAAYLHVTSNNTIFGTQFHDFPATGDVPLVADMSSDIMCRPLDVSQFGLIYAGAQKNLGPSGVTVVIIREDLLDRAGDDVPIYLNYRTQAGKNSLYNTPPCFAIYTMGLVLQWIKDLGGLTAMEKRNQEKADLLYGAFDSNSDFFRSPVAKANRSLMNVTFRLPSEDLEKKFIAEGTEAGFIGLKGHRSVGGMRISMYNATGPESIQALVAFMEDFAKKNG